MPAWNFSLRKMLAVLTLHTEGGCHHGSVARAVRISSRTSLLYRDLYQMGAWKAYTDQAHYLQEPIRPLKK